MGLKCDLTKNVLTKNVKKTTKKTSKNIFKISNSKRERRKVYAAAADFPRGSAGKKFFTM
jgi:hypothetical protein